MRIWTLNGILLTSLMLFIRLTFRTLRVINERGSHMSDQVKEETIEVEEKAALDGQAEEANDVMASVVHSDDDAVVSAKALLETGAHLGHQTRRWNPRMKEYIYGQRSGVHLIDLTKTVTKVQEAYLALRHIVSENGKVLFVGTKPQASETIAEEAIRSGSFYMNNKWLGGTLTNFKTISKSTRLLKTLQDQDNDGQFDQLPKKVALEKRKQIERLSKNLEGIKEMRRTPNAVVVVDPITEHNAVAEAKKLNIPVFALLDTNCDPTAVDYEIPCNEESIKTIKLVVGILADAVVEAKGGEPLYAYKSDSEVFASMEDAVKTVDKVEELHLIKEKFRADTYFIRGKSSHANKKSVKVGGKANTSKKEVASETEPAKEEEEVSDKSEE